MAFHFDHIRYLEHTGLAKPYLERNYKDPIYIGQDGKANIDNITSTLNGLNSRAGRLAESEVLKPQKQDKFDPNKAPDPLDFKSKPTKSNLQTVELPLISDVWNGAEPINYHCQIEVGSPPQVFYVDLDTGSSLLWLQSRLNGLLDPEIPGQNAYIPFKSTTAIDQVREDRAKYGDGDLVTVSLYQDRIFLGKMFINDALIGASPTHGIKSSFQLSKANGILGLGFPTDPANMGRKNLVQMLYDQGKVKHASFALIGPRVDPKLAEKIDKKVLMQPRGTFVIGSVDPAYYTGSIAWCPQIISMNRWIVKLDRITINGKVAFENQTALIDTGTAYIIASPSNYEKTQTFIPGAKTLDQKHGLMFSFSPENLQNVGFVFGGRELKLQRQDFGLGAVKDKAGQMCSSITRLQDWSFPDDLWVVGGIFLDNMVTIFDYGERKVGFADIPSPEPNAATATAASSQAPDASPSPSNAMPASATAGATAGGAAAPEDHSGPQPRFIAPDTSTVTIPDDSNPPAGREFSQLITFNPKALPSVATGFHSLDLGSEHVRAITFADSVTHDSFRLYFNASADKETHGTKAINSDSDTVLRTGKAAWLRTMPDDQFLQVGRISSGKPYDGSWSAKGIAASNVPVTFSRKFAGAQPPKVVLWLSGMDFSKAYNWRLQATASNITNDGFTLNVGPWGDSILYMAEVTWIAHADIEVIQSGTFSTEDVRKSGWALQTSGVAKFVKPFAGKNPNLACGLSKIEFGCGRDIKVQTNAEADEEGIQWSMNSDGNTHQYITASSWIAFDADITTVSASIF